MNNLSNNNNIKIFNEKLNQLPEKEKEYKTDLLINNLASNLLNETKSNRTKILESLDLQKRQKVEHKLKELIKQKKQQEQKLEQDKKINNSKLYDDILIDLQSDIYKLNQNNEIIENNKYNIRKIIKQDNSLEKKMILLQNSDWDIKKIKNKFIYTYKKNIEFDSNKYHLRKYHKTNNIVLYNKDLNKEYTSNELKLLIEKKEMYRYLKQEGWYIKKKYNRPIYVYINIEFDSKDFKIYKYKNTYALYNLKTKKIIPIEELKNSSLTLWQKIIKFIQSLFTVKSSSIYPMNLSAFMFIIFTFSIFLFVFENVSIILIRYITEKLHDFIFSILNNFEVIDNLVPSEIFIINIEDWIPVRIFFPVYALFYIFFNFIFRRYGWNFVSYLIIIIFISIGIFRGIANYIGIII